MRPVLERLLIVAALLLALVAGVSGSARAQGTADIDDLQETVEAIETEIAETQLDDIPQVPALGQVDFDALVEEITENDPVFGPISDEIAHDPAFIRLYYASGYYESFMLEATFGNPHEDEDATFDFGVEFRINGSYTNPSRMYLVFDDSGNWMVAVGTDTEWSAATEFPLGEGRFRRLNDEPGQENKLTLIVDEDELHFAINGEYVASVGVPSTGEGGLAIGTGFYTGDTFDGATTPFTDFAVWEV